jgi:hypothetical protein
MQFSQADLLGFSIFLVLPNYRADRMPAMNGIGGVCPPVAGMASVRSRRLTGLRGGIPGGSHKPTGRGFIGGGNQHTNTLNLQLRLLSSGIVCRHGCSQAVTAQHADDQFRLSAAGNDRHSHRRAVHDLSSSAPDTAP